MMQVISLTICPFVQRVTATLEAKKLPYTVTYISLKNPPSWFLQVSPHAQVPLLIADNGTVLFESDAIIEYLDDVYAPLQTYDTPEKRAISRAWCYQATKIYLTQCSTMQSADEQTMTIRAKKLNNAFEKIEKVIGEHPFFTTNTVGNVDMAWLVVLHRTHIVKFYTGYDFLACYPKMRKWRDNLYNTHIAQRAVADNFIDAFCNFYLSPHTYLGKLRLSQHKTNGNCAPNQITKKPCCC